MDLPMPHRDLSTGSGRSEGGTTEPSPSLNFPEPAATVPGKRRRNSAATGSNKRVALGQTRANKRQGPRPGPSHGGSGLRNGSGSVAADGGLALPANIPNGFLPAEGETPVPCPHSHSRVGSAPPGLEPITEGMTTPEQIAVHERNLAAEEAYNDDRRRNNQSAKRSRLKKEMYMVEMDMAIKHYKRNVAEFSTAYEHLKSVLLRHNLFSEAELGDEFAEPVVWNRSVFMPEQEADIADHRAKLEKASQQPDLPKLGLDFADKVCELVGRRVPMEDKETAAQALIEHQQKIEDTERKHFQLVLQMHELERKMEETRAKLGENGRANGELGATMVKYGHFAVPEGTAQGTQGASGPGLGLVGAQAQELEGMRHTQGRGLDLGRLPAPVEAMNFGVSHQGAQLSRQLQRQQDVRLAESEVSATVLSTGILPVRLGQQHPQEQPHQNREEQPEQPQQENTNNDLLPGQANERADQSNSASSSENNSPLQAEAAADQEASETTPVIPYEETDEHRAFLAEIDEYAQAHGDEAGMGVIKPDFFDESTLFGVFPGGASFEGMGMPDDSLFGFQGLHGTEAIQGQQ